MSFEKAVEAKPKAHDTGTLFYMRIIRMNNLPLQPLVWQDLDEDPMLAPVSISESPLHHYVVLKDGEGIKVRYSKKGADFDYATGFATIDEAKQWAWNHYNEKMQPYVKPSSTWIYASDQLPVSDSSYLCAIVDKGFINYRITMFWTVVDKFAFNHEKVLAWMPLPEPPTCKQGE